MSKILTSLNRKKCKPCLFLPVFFLLLGVTTSCQPGPVILVTSSGKSQYTLPQIPFPAHKHYATATLRPNHISQKRQDDLVRVTYDKWKTQYLLRVPTSGGQSQMYRISAGKTKKDKSYSEGQGYGMILAAYMAGYDPLAQDIFNGLWLFARNHPSRINNKFMAYQVPINKSRQDSAFDGDCDMALALILADSQWGSGGQINYRQEALSLTKALLQNAIGRDSNLPMLGDWVQPNGKRYNQYTIRSSDIMPSHFKVFYKTTKDPKWQEVFQRCQTLVEYMQTRHSSKTGLLPDFIVGTAGKEPGYKPAPSRFLESSHDGHYFYNATRVPWRLGFDALLNEDPVSLRQVKRIGHWVIEESGGKPSNIRPGYKLNGRRLNNEEYISKAFIAPFGIAVMATGDYQDFVNITFDLCVKLHQDYYEDTIGLLCLLIMTGNSWLPG